MRAIDNISVTTLAAQTGFRAAWLRETFHLREGTFARQNAVVIPYYDGTGRWLYDRYRLSDGSMRYRVGTTPTLYGLSRVALRTAPPAVLWLCEGESDHWTFSHYGVLSLGIPGATGWRKEHALALSGVRFVYVWIEPDAGGETLLTAMAATLPRAWVVRGSAEAKDPNALHVACCRDGLGFLDVLRERQAAATSLSQPPKRPPRPRSPADTPAAARAGTRRVNRARQVSAVHWLKDRGVELKGTGSNRYGHCPLPGHSDIRASFSVHAESGLWKCWGCNRTGDIITLVRLVEGVSFTDALALLLDDPHSASRRVIITAGERRQGAG